MKFLMTYASADQSPPSPAKLAELGAFTEKMTASGKVVMTGGLVRPSRGIQLRCEGGKTSVMDGPFAESKEVIDGFALVEAKDRDEAIALAAEFMAVAGDGTGEVLAVYEGGPP
jgi:hypothetical protein